MRVLIDPGHAPGNANRGPTGYFEYRGMWTLSNYLKEALAASGVFVQLTRSENENPALTARGGMARGFDLFISQHSNGFDGTVRGSECFYSVRHPENRAIAARFSAETAWLMNHRDRGAKTKAGNGGLDFFGVIRSAVAAGCPRVFLMESGFHDNPVDEAFLLQDENLQRLAVLQAGIILDVLGAGQASNNVPGINVSPPMTTPPPTSAPQPSVPMPPTTPPPVVQPPLSPSAWATEAWEWAVANGLTDGTNPQNPVTREQMVTILHRYHSLQK